MKNKILLLYFILYFFIQSVIGSDAIIQHNIIDENDVKPTNINACACE